jgi:uncharacterized protein (TIGR03437 family)
VFSLAGVVSAASGVAGSVAPGELLSVFGKDLGPARALAAVLDETGGIAVDVGKVRVTFDGIPAPLLVVSNSQINLAAPFALTGRGSAQIQVHYEGISSAPVSVPVAGAAPGLFTLNGRGVGPGAVLNQDGRVNSAANPARPGSIIILYGTGAGQTEPEGFDGRLAVAPYARPRAFVVVRVAGIEAEVLYAGVAPGLVEGTIQVNARMAATVGAGDTVPVQMQVGNAVSQAGVTIAVSNEQ